MLAFDRLTGNRRLKGENPYRNLDDFDLANAAGKLVEEILKVAKRTPAERLALTERAELMLIACNHRIHAMRRGSGNTGRSDA